MSSYPASYPAVRLTEDEWKLVYEKLTKLISDGDEWKHELKDICERINEQAGLGNEPAPWFS